MAATRPDHTGNQILDALSPEELRALRPHLEPFELVIRDVLMERGDPVKRVFFPTEGFISLVSVMEDGSSVEMATIGPEGMVCVPTVLGAAGGMNCDAIGQMPGHALVMDTGIFLERAQTEGRFRELIDSFTHSLFVMVSQNAACNRLHSMNERACRWLLMARDRSKGDVFPLTHEFLAQMLGVRRASVSEAAEALQASGTISYRR